MIAKQFRFWRPNGDNIRNLWQTLYFRPPTIAIDGYALHTRFIIQPIDETLERSKRDDLRDLRGNENFSTTKACGTALVKYTVMCVCCVNLLIFAIYVHGVDALAMRIVDHIALLIHRKRCYTFQLEGEHYTLSAINT